jgi:hypothetical protein
VGPPEFGLSIVKDDTSDESLNRGKSRDEIQKLQLRNSAAISSNNGTQTERCDRPDISEPTLRADDHPPRPRCHPPLPQCHPLLHLVASLLWQPINSPVRRPRHPI